MRSENEMLYLIKYSLPGLNIKHVQLNTSGWDNDIIIINQNTVFRFPKTEEITEKVVKEVLLVKSLVLQNPSVSLPEYSLIYDSEGGLKCVYYPYITGVPLSKLDRIPPLKENARIIGEFLTSLHSTENQANLKTVHTYTFWNKLYKSVKREISPFLNNFQQTEINDTFTEFLDGFSFSKYQKTVIHGDLSPSNIIFDQESELVNGIIDFTDAQMGDPAFDFAGFYWEYGPEFTKQILSYYSGMESGNELFNRVRSFYGLQSIFHEILHGIDKGHYINWNTVLDRFLELKSGNS